jgi:hypothetical protein
MKQISTFILQIKNAQNETKFLCLYLTSIESIEKTKGDISGPLFWVFYSIFLYFLVLLCPFMYKQEQGKIMSKFYTLFRGEE